MGSAYIAQNIGDRIAPCLVPFAMVILLDLASPHLTQPCCSIYIKLSTLATIGGRPLSSNLLKRTENLHLSNALLQSKTVTTGLIPPLKMCCIISDTSQV